MASYTTLPKIESATFFVNHSVAHATNYFVLGTEQKITRLRSKYDMHDICLSDLMCSSLACRSKVCNPNSKYCTNQFSQFHDLHICLSPLVYQLEAGFGTLCISCGSTECLLAYRKDNIILLGRHVELTCADTSHIDPI